MSKPASKTEDFEDRKARIEAWMQELERDVAEYVAFLRDWRERQKRKDDAA